MLEIIIGLIVIMGWLIAWACAPKADRPIVHVVAMLVAGGTVLLLAVQHRALNDSLTQRAWSDVYLQGLH